MPEMTDDAKLKADLVKVKSEHKRAMVGHAVAHLNNLMPRFGAKPYRDGFSTSETLPDMDDVPAEVRNAVTKTTIAAARYLEAAFDHEREG